jgi:hypothetical protein
MSIGKVKKRFSAADSQQDAAPRQLSDNCSGYDSGQRCDPADLTRQLYDPGMKVAAGPFPVR